MAQDSSAIRITARRTDQKVNLGNSGARASLRVPAGTILELRTSNGSINVTGSTGDVTAHTSNGKIQIRDSVGRLTLDTSNGQVEVNSSSASVDARTSNGQISFSGKLADGSHVFRTSNGRIVITLPAGTIFGIDAGTSNGKITSDFAVNRTGGSGDNQLRGATGNNPAVSIQASTSNGAIELHQQ